MTPIYTKDNILAHLDNIISNKYDLNTNTLEAIKLTGEEAGKFITAIAKMNSFKLKNIYISQFGLDVSISDFGNLSIVSRFNEFLLYMSDDVIKVYYKGVRIIIEEPKLAPTIIPDKSIIAPEFDTVTESFEPIVSQPKQSIFIRNLRRWFG